MLWPHRTVRPNADHVAGSATTVTACQWGLAALRQPGAVEDIDGP
ncbi:hypothetical protein [Kitasatospora sp. NBC_01300]|nr:hypothetical protein OG556_38475 [Kitasatospora sp. NBC_01300]